MSVRAKKSSITVEVEQRVDVEIEDIIHLISTELLVEELRTRSDAPRMVEGDDECIADALMYLRRGDVRECLTQVERMLPREFAGVLDRAFR